MKRAGLIGLAMCLMMTNCSLTPRPRPWTKSEKGLAVASTVAAAWNYHETSNMLERPNTYEVNPLYNDRPSNSELVTGVVISQFLTLSIAHWYPTIDLPVFGECEFRIPLLFGKTLINASFAIHDSEVGK